ncbi:unnamed protein product [Symbiodinium sp. CCMP2592]|nr:unnamed protein product [Symbiodinium sp. CCMP2592]
MDEVKDEVHEHEVPRGRDSPPTRRLRVKTPPKSYKKEKATAVKSAAKPAAPASSAEASVTNWSPAHQANAVKLLFSWPRRMWDAFVQFRRSVKDAEGRDQAHFEAAGAVVRASKRQRTEWNSEERTAILQGMLGVLSEFTMSTSFSGIDAPTTAFLSLGLGLCQSLDLSADHLPRPRSTFAVEWQASCQQELLRHPHAAEHVFGDINDFFRPTLRTKLDSIVAEGKIHSVLWPLIKSGNAMRKEAFCVKHQKMCQVLRCRVIPLVRWLAAAPCLCHGMLVQVDTARCHCGGTPCTDYSIRGLQLGTEGTTFVPFLAFCGMRIVLQEPVVIQENVDNFETDLLERYLGHLYHISVESLSPDQYGFPVLRPRKWTILRHKYKTSCWASPWSAFAKMFQSDMWFGAYASNIFHDVPAWVVYFDADADELFEELCWACSRPESLSKDSGCPFASAVELREAMLKDPEAVRSAFLAALTAAESSFLDHYQASRPGQVFALNQNPEVSLTASQQTHLRTIIRNTGILWRPASSNLAIVLWSDRHGRWMTASETLRAQAFPVSVELSDGDTKGKLETGAPGALEAASDAIWGKRSLNERFGDATGKELQTKIFEMYEVTKAAGGVRVDWYMADKSRNIVRHACNQRKQQSIRRSYVRAILEYGVAEGCRGECWLVEPAQPGQPYQAITFGTLYLKDLNNQFHHGGSISFIELVSGVTDVDQAFHAYADRARITSRNSNYHEQRQGQIAGHRVHVLLVAMKKMSLQEKYDAASFKVSRALRNKLNAWGLFQTFDDFYGEHADFLHQELPKAETTLATMNSFATMLESRFSGQPPALVGQVFFEISKFCVPLLSGDDGGRQPPFLFSKGPESIAVSEAQQRLCCPVAGAVFVKKLATKGQPQSADAAPKKRPRVPDLSDAVPKKASRAKGKAKAKAKAASGKDATNALEKETQESLQADVEFALGDEATDGQQGLRAGSRQRLWLDDVLAALQRCQTGPFAAAASSKAVGQLVSMLLSFAVEFAFTGSVRLQKAKPLKVRPALQNLFLAALSRGRSALPGGSSSEEILGKLAQDIAAEGPSLRSLSTTPKHDAGQSATAVLRDSKALQECMSFLMTNREKDIRKQPAFFATMSKLKSGLCTCGQADDWDREAGSCLFHEGVHTLSDMTWALSTLMEQEAVIPLSASAIGAAGLQLVMKVQEQAEKEKVESAQASGEPTGDASSSSDTRTSKAQDPQPKKMDVLLNAIAKEGRFLLEKQGEDSGETKWALNGSLVESLLTVRAKYLLSTMLGLIVKPQLEAAAAGQRPKLVEFEDLDAEQAEWLYDLLVYMCKSGEFTDAHGFILELECRYMLQSPGDADMKTWSAMWTEVFERALAARNKHVKTNKNKDETIELGKTLPATKMVINKSFFKEAAAAAAASAESGEVKVENDGGVNPSGQPAQGQQEHTVQPAVPYFQSIYTATAQQGTIHTLDVLAVQAQIQNILLMRAGCKSSEKLLGAMFSDSRSCAIIAATSLTKELAGERIYAFGSISTEQSPKSVKAVASATFGDGDGITMHYFMSAEGFQKLTSLCPCPVWFVKPVTDAKKALFESSEVEETVECSDAHGGKITVHLRMPFIAIREQALLSLIEKEAVQPQGELICTRVYFPNEKATTGKKQPVQPQMALGGLCFRKQEGHEGVTLKVEKNDDLLLVNPGNHPKHCSHLLK